MKKLFSVIIAVLMLASLSAPVFAADDNCIVRYTFDDAETGLQSEGMDTTIMGDANGISFADGVATFNGIWLQAYPTDDRFEGLTEVTVAFRVKVDGVTLNQWPFEITSEFQHAWPVEHYLGCRLDSNYLVERYGNDSTDRPASATGPLLAGEWMDLVCVYPEDGSTLVYINGELIQNVPATEGYDLSIANCIGKDPMLNIGKANWGNELFYGELDILEIYNKALSANEVATLWGRSAGNETTDIGGDNDNGNSAPQTGFATAILATVAVFSGAYIVTKKH